MFSESGVNYTRAVEESYGARPFFYRSLHLKTKQAFEGRVYVFGEAEQFLKLLVYWNRGEDWAYFPI